MRGPPFVPFAVSLTIAEGAPSFAERGFVVCAEQRVGLDGDWHYITCSCYRRRKFFASVSRRDLFLEILEQVRAKYDARRTRESEGWELARRESVRTKPTTSARRHAERQRPVAADLR